MVARRTCFPFVLFAICNRNYILTSFFGESSISLTEMLKTFFPAIIIGIGHASFMLILLPYVQRSTNSQFAIRGSLVGGLWGMLIPAPLLLSLLLFPITNLSQYILLVLFLISMILFFWSYLVRDRLISSVIVPGKRPPKTSPRYCRTSVFFWLQFWSRQMGILFLLLLCCTGFSMLLSMTKRQEFIPTFHPFSFLFFLGVFVPCLSATWVTEMRPFRALPMTAGKLSIFFVVYAIYQYSLRNFVYSCHVLCNGNARRHGLCAGCRLLCPGLSSILYNTLILFGQIGIVLCCFLLYPSYIYLQRDLFIMVPIIGLVISPFFIYQIKNNSEVYRRRSSLLQSGHVSGSL